MKATEAKLLQILGAVSQFIIPIDQRTDSWTLKECQQLWADILRAGSTEEIGVHFIGSVVHIDEGLGNLAVEEPLQEGSSMNEILFVVEEAEDGSYRASAVGEAIHTEADSLEELHREIRDAVHCHFEEGQAPPLIRLHHVRQELLTL